MLKLWFVYFVLVLMLLFSVWQVVKYPVGLSRVWKCPQQIDTTTARMAHNYHEAAYGFCGWNFSFPLSLLLHCKYSHIFRGKNSFFGFRKQLHFLCNYMEHTTEKRWDSGGDVCTPAAAKLDLFERKPQKREITNPFALFCAFACATAFAVYLYLCLALTPVLTLVFVLSERLAYHLKYIWEFTNALPYGCSNLCIEFFFRLQLSLAPIPWAVWVFQSKCQINCGHNREKGSPDFVCLINKFQPQCQPTAE